jgi:hypothetical protein
MISPAVWIRRFHSRRRDTFLPNGHGTTRGQGSTRLLQLAPLQAPVRASRWPPSHLNAGDWTPSQATSRPASSTKTTPVPSTPAQAHHPVQEWFPSDFAQPSRLLSYHTSVHITLTECEAFAKIRLSFKQTGCASRKPLPSTTKYPPATIPP